MEPKFYNKNNDLTAYSFACGYVQEKVKYTKEKTFRKEMYMEHDHFHVRSFSCDTDLTNFERLTWDVYERNELTKARKQFNSIKFQ